MFGFIEKTRADTLIECGVIRSYETFSTSEGEAVAIVAVRAFRMVTEVMQRLAPDFGYAASDVLSVPSDIAGMRILLHPFWTDDVIFDALTPGGVKESELYLKIREKPSSSRFLYSAFKDAFHATICTMLNEQSNPAEEEDVTDGEATYAGTASPSPEVKEERPKLKARNEESLKLLNQIERNTRTEFQDVDIGNNEFVKVSYNSSISMKCLKLFAARMKKHVYVLQRGRSDTTYVKSLLKSSKTKKSVKEQIIFLHTKPDHPKLYAGIEMQHTLFGYEIKGLQQLHGGTAVNERATNNPLGVVFADFDYAYRDYKTGIIWALQKGTDIYFLADLAYFPVSLTDIVFKELGDRYLGELSYEEMVRRDIEYFNASAQHDRENFVNLSVKNSKNLITELKSEFLRAKESYVEHMNQAMEFAKTAQRLEENLLMMNEEKLAKEEAERCSKMFDDVLSLPKISAVKVSGDVVDVYTKNIYVFHDKNKTWHDIGAFHIQIGMFSSKYDSSRTVRMFNTKHQIHAFNEAMQAPHVFNDGHLCHGNIVGAMIDAYKRRDFYQMVLMLIMFLESANLDDPAGQYLGRWPVVSEEEATAAEKSDDDIVQIFSEQSEEEAQYDEMLEIPIHI